MSDAIAIGEDVTAGIGEPLRKKLAVIDEDVRASGSVGAILKIIYAAVPEERGAVCVKEDGRKAVILAIENQLAGRGAKQSFCKRTRRKIRIKDDKCVARGVEEQNHHERDGGIDVF
jgi:hypothetical protein